MADSSSRDAERPFFTVLIPTMNRPGFLETTLKTALWQNFPDFEVIVSDNSNDAEKQKQNQAVIGKYSADSRLRYVRPDSWLNMPDHWEFATLQAKGTYVLVLTDRRVMRPSALKYLHSQIRSMPPNVGMVSWFDFCDYSDLSRIITGGSRIGQSVMMDSKDLVNRFASFDHWKLNGFWFHELPHTLNSCYRRDLAEKVRGLYGRLFRPVSPDFMAAFLMLAYNDKVLYIDRPLYLQHSGSLVGNGAASFVDGMEKFTSTFPEVDPYAGTPVRLNTLFNTLVRDFLTVKEIVGDRFSGIEPDWVGYYVTNYLEFIQKERMGSGMDIRKLKELWLGGVSRLSKNQQEDVWRLVNRLGPRRTKFAGLRRWARKLGLVPFYSRTLGMLRRLRQGMEGKPVYRSVLEAAEKTDDVLAEPVSKT